MNKNIIDQLPTDILITGHYESRIIIIAGKQLLPEKSLKIKNHSPDGFNWGYGGSGPSQLALAILLHFMPEEYALKYYHDFKWNVVAKWPKSDFEIKLNLKEEIERIVYPNSSL